jgi:hypothetical protein
MARHPILNESPRAVRPPLGMSGGLNSAAPTKFRPHAAPAHEFCREQGRALEVLAQRLDARS